MNPPSMHVPAVKRLVVAIAPMLLAIAPTPSAQAQDVAPNVAIPFYTSAHATQGVYGSWYAPQSERFKAAALALAPAIERYCAAPQQDKAAQLVAATEQLRTAILAWETVSAVSLGPLIERRSARNIDFQPFRPTSLQKATQSAPADARALERIGGPAKGFGALEHLLAQQANKPDAASCRYAVVAAQGVAQEAEAIAAGFQSLDKTHWSEEAEATTETMAEFINQWVGGLERLRWQRLEKPVKSAGRKPIVWHRADAASTLNALQAQWQGLRQLAVVLDRQQIPQPGTDLVPIEAYLRGRGLKELADEWAQTVGQANQAMTGLRDLSPASVSLASASLKKLKKLMEAQVAPALEINIGFSDADGD